MDGLTAVSSVFKERLYLMNQKLPRNTQNDIFKRLIHYLKQERLLSNLNGHMNNLAAIRIVLQLYIVVFFSLFVGFRHDKRLN